jgi:hypothetical protein
MDWTFGIALLIGFAPVFVLMDLVLKKYTYPRVENPFFKDTTFFGMFTVGIVEGAIAVFAIGALGLLDSQFSILLMIMMGLIELMAMVVVMNLKRFRGNSDSIFYGYGLGLGMAGGMGSGLAYLMLMGATSGAEGTSLEPYMIVVTVLLSISLALILGSSGTNIGEGIARHVPMQFVMQAGVPLIAYNMLFATLSITGGFVYILILVAMVALGAFFFYKNLYVNLPRVIKEVLKMNGIKRDDIPKAK